MDILGSRYPRASEAYLQELLRQYREASWRRRQQLRALRSEGDWRAYCRGVRKRFRAALGPLPERTPLKPRVTGVLERDGYVVEQLLIESQPGFHVTANLYRPPVVTAPLPAVLGPIGHWADGKAEGRVQARQPGRGGRLIRASTESSSSTNGVVAGARPALQIPTPTCRSTPHITSWPTWSAYAFT